MAFKKIVSPVAFAIVGALIGFRVGIAAAPTRESEMTNMQRDPAAYITKTLKDLEYEDATKSFSDIRMEYGRNGATVGGVGGAVLGLTVAIGRGGKDNA